MSEEMAAVNCFGEVVDGATLDDLGLPNTKANRAKIALRFMYNDDKKGQASRYVQNLKDKYGNGSSTLCIVYNASGDPLRIPTAHSWYNGSFYNVGCPGEIGNGQWAGWLHVHDQGKATGSLGAVAYTGKNRHDQDRDFLVAWSSPWGPQPNSAYCEIGDVNFYEGRWGEIDNRLENSGYTSNVKADGMAIEAETERGSSPHFTAIIKQE